LSGTNKEAEEIKRKISDFLRDSLKLELSSEKTKITNIRKKCIYFLGYQIRIQADSHRTKRTVIRTKTQSGWSTSMRRTTSGKYYVLPNSTKIYKTLTNKGFCKGGDFYPIGIKAWAYLTEYQIVQKYRSLFIGIIQHYKKCDSLRTLNRVHYILLYSCAKTIATRQKITMPQVFTKYGKTLRITTTVTKNKDGGTIHRTIEFPALTSLRNLTTCSDSAGLSRSWDPL